MRYLSAKVLDHLTKIAKMRNNATSFLQMDGGSLYEVWERFKDLLPECP